MIDQRIRNISKRQQIPSAESNSVVPQGLLINRIIIWTFHIPSCYRIFGGYDDPDKKNLLKEYLPK